MRRRGAQKHYYLMALPGMLWLLLFSIIPMSGIVMAFQDFNPSLGLFGSPWVGFENFEYLWQLDDSRQVLVNTLIIAISKVILNIVIPLTFALLLNEVRHARYKRIVQTVVYLPHFLSWVILSSIILSILGYKGVLNTFLGALGVEPTLWMGEADLFRGLIIGTDVWKEFGYNAVIFLAALTGINPNLYEAAAIDGAGKARCLWHITLPSLLNTVVLLSVLGLGNVLNAGFDQVFNMYSPLVYSTGDILDTWVYRIGLVDLQFSLATTAGLFKSVVSFVMIAGSYSLAYKFADYTIF